jgi:hypothetical protein
MRKLLGTAAAVSLLMSGAAFAQGTAPAPVPTVNPSTDLVPFVPNGQPRPSQQFTLPAWLAGAPAYTDAGVGLTGGTYTFKQGQVDYFMQPAGTLSAITLTTEPSPVDGQRECFLSTQTTTTLTWNANTGQTMGPTITAGVANTPICITYEKAVAKWQRSP